MEYSSYYGNGQLQSRVTADQFLVKPRQFSVFKIKSVNEAILTNTRFEIFGPPPVDTDSSNRLTTDGEDGDLGTQLSDGIRGLAELKGMGRITRAVLFGMSMETFFNEKPILHLQAQHATMNISKAEMILEKAIIENHQTATRLIGKEIFWNEKQKTFKIPGEYHLQTPSGTIRGEKSIFGFDLQPITRQTFPRQQP
jgi:hypothetical protein